MIQNSSKFHSKKSFHNMKRYRGNNDEANVHWFVRQIIKFTWTCGAPTCGAFEACVYSSLLVSFSEYYSFAKQLDERYQIERSAHPEPSYGYFVPKDYLPVQDLYFETMTYLVQDCGTANLRRHRS